MMGGKVADLARVDHGDREAGQRQSRGQGALEPAGGLDHDQEAAAGAEPGDQPADPARIVGEAGALAGRQQVDVEPTLAHVHADEGLGLSEALGHRTIRPRRRACRPIDCSA